MTGTLKLRPYQEKVVKDIGKENAIVKMPTGSGKTFVAAEFIRRSLLTERQTMPETSSSNKKRSALFFGTHVRSGGTAEGCHQRVDGWQ